MRMIIMKLINNTYIECTRLESRVLLLLKEVSISRLEYTKNKKLVFCKLTNAEIAMKLFCSKATVENIIKVFYKMNIFTRVYEDKFNQVRCLIFNAEIQKVDFRKLKIKKTDIINIDFLKRVNSKK